MKKIIAIITIAAITAVFGLIGCEKKEAQKPAEQSAPTASAPTATAPAPAPEKK